MNKKLNIKIGFILIPFAFVFLFEPTFKLSDPIPDILGYLLLYCAIVDLSDLNHRIRQALKGIKLSIFLSVSRFIAVKILKDFFAESEASIGLLLFSFVFAVLELLVLIPAYKGLFDGLLSLGLMHEGSYVYSKRTRKKLKIDPESGEKTLYIRESHNNATEKAYYLTVCFLIVKELASVMPELTSLSTNSDYEFIGIVRLLAFLAVLPIGIIWLIKTVIYFVKLNRDKIFVNNLSVLHDNFIKERPLLKDARTLSTGFFIMIIAFLISADFYADHINLIHNAIFYFVLLISTVVLSKFSKKWFFVAGASTVGPIISYFTHQLNTALYSDPNFSAKAAKQNIKIYYAFYEMASFSILDALWMLLTVVLAVVFLLDVYKKHSFLTVTNNSKEISNLRKTFIKGCIPVLAFATLSSAGYIYYIFSQPNEFTEHWYFRFSAIIEISLSILFAVTAAVFVYLIKRNIHARYRTDL